jgi:hypothetical protein
MWFSVLKPFFFFNMVVFCCVEKFFCLALSGLFKERRIKRAKKFEEAQARAPERMIGIREEWRG